MADQKLHPIEDAEGEDPILALVPAHVLVVAAILVAPVPGHDLAGGTRALTLAADLGHQVAARAGHVPRSTIRIAARALQDSMTEITATMLITWTMIAGHAPVPGQGLASEPVTACLVVCASRYY